MRPDRRPKVAKYYRNEVLKKAVADGLIKADILATATEEQLQDYAISYLKAAIILANLSSKEPCVP